MIDLGEDELTCDLAETYHVLNWRELPPSLAATLSAGLGEDSRIKRKMSGQKLTLDQTLLAVIADGIHILAWMNTKDGQKNRNRPKSITKMLSGKDKKQDDELMTFSTPDEYEAWRKKKQRERGNEQ